MVPRNRGRKWSGVSKERERKTQRVVETDTEGGRDTRTERSSASETERDKEKKEAGRLLDETLRKRALYGDACGTEEKKNSRAK